MIGQAHTVFTKECRANNGVLIIENIFSQDRPKTDIIREIIREIIENTACLDSEYLVQSACRNKADYGSQAKEETN